LGIVFRGGHALIRDLFLQAELLVLLVLSFLTDV
jgi:hypothetical protein